MHHHDHRQPLHCIVPPHMLREIAKNGNEAQRNYALATLTASAAFRGQRAAMMDMAALMRAVTGTSGKNRIIYDAKFSTSLPGTIVRREGDPPVADVTANEAYDGSGITYDLYHEIYGRDSIDGRGMRLDSTVHYGKGYDNAFWNGSQMVYGDGDEDLSERDRLFNRFTIAIDIIAHELTHGVTQFEAKLAYWEQSGALNESFSDVFGALVKQYQRNQTAAEADWIIGEGLFTANVNGVGIRSMKEPGSAYNDPLIGKDPQPGHMNAYVTTSEDNGGVHINSGIPNKAFYVAALEMGGYAWEKAGQIWYVTLRDKLNASTRFTEAAAKTYQTAAELFGNGSLEQQAVKKGWDAVGLPIDDGSTPPTPPTPGGDGCLASLLRSIGAAPK